jgi:hypothetical protein
MVVVSVRLSTERAEISLLFMLLDLNVGSSAAFFKA